MCVCVTDDRGKELEESGGLFLANYGSKRRRLLVEHVTFCRVLPVVEHAASNNQVSHLAEEVAVKVVFTIIINILIIIIVVIMVSV